MKSPNGGVVDAVGRRLYLLRLAGFQWIRSGMQSVMHDIEELMAMARRQPNPEPYEKFESALLHVVLDPVVPPVVHPFVRVSRSSGTPPATPAVHPAALAQISPKCQIEVAHFTGNGPLAQSHPVESPVLRYP